MLVDIFNRGSALSRWTVRSREVANGMTRGLTPSKKGKRVEKLIWESFYTPKQGNGRRKPRTVTDIEILPVYIPYDRPITNGTVHYRFVYNEQSPNMVTHVTSGNLIDGIPSTCTRSFPSRLCPLRLLISSQCSACSLLPPDF